MKKYNAVILGGGRSPIDENLPKGNTSFNGRPLAEIAYKALINGYEFNKVALVMNPDKKINLRKQDKFVEPTFCNGSLLSGYRGIKAIDDGSSAYVITAGDLPFLDARTIEAFMQQINNNSDIDIIFPLITREINEKKFPNRKRTYQPLREGYLLPGSIGYLSQRAIRQNESLVEKIISLDPQKKLRVIFKGVVYLGLKSVLRSHHQKSKPIKYLSSFPKYEKLFPKFSIRELEEKASKFTGVNVKLIDFPYPECAFDIDNLQQLKLGEDLNKAELGSLEATLDPISNS